jgi:hypothetical protein
VRDNFSDIEVNKPQLATAPSIPKAEVNAHELSAAKTIYTKIQSFIDPLKPKSRVD